MESAFHRTCHQKVPHLFITQFNKLIITFVSTIYKKIGCILLVRNYPHIFPNREPFFIEEDYNVIVDMMFIGGDFKYHEDKKLGVEIIALPYKGREVKNY